MTRFQFRLARVLRVRRIEEEIARGEWLGAVAEAQRASARASAIADELDTALAELGALRSAVHCRVSEVLALEGTLDSVGRALRRGRERQATLERQAEAARPPWERRRQAVQGLERWRDRAREKHERERIQKESALMDEISSARTLRRGRPGPGAVPGPQPSP